MADPMADPMNRLKPGIAESSSLKSAHRQLNADHVGEGPHQAHYPDKRQLCRARPTHPSPLKTVAYLDSAAYHARMRVLMRLACLSGELVPLRRNEQSMYIQDRISNLSHNEQSVRTLGAFLGL